jgi:hypothetical protein
MTEPVSEAIDGIHQRCGDCRALVVVALGFGRDDEDDSKIHQGAFKLSVFPPALTAAVDVRNESPVCSVYMYLYMYLCTCTCTVVLTLCE